MCGISGLSNCAASAGRWRGIAHALNMSEGGVNRVITRIATVELPEQQPRSVKAHQRTGKAGAVHHCLVANNEITVEHG